ncbi:MAG: hypothetical protein ACC655_10460, partial [Rhodothermia bacterium]
TEGVDLLTQDFENFGQGSASPGATVPLSEGWGNVANGTIDDLDWTPDLGGTPSTGTGPSVDNTLGTAAGTYLYVETSGSGSPNKVANLRSPVIDLSGTTNNRVEFYYHMYGSAMGSLSVQGSTDGGATWSSDLFTASGNLGDQWNQAVVDLSAFDGESNFILRVQGTSGANDTSDMAVDDFRFFWGTPVDGIRIVSNTTGAVSIASSVTGMNVTGGYYDTT